MAVKQEVEELLNDSKVLVKAEPFWDRHVSSDSPSIIIGIAKIEKEISVKSEAIDTEHTGSKKGPQHVKIEKSSKESGTRNLRKVELNVPHLKERGPSKKTLQRPSRKTLQCKVCSKKYKTKHLLQMHELLHSDTKPFQCDQCPQAFYRKSCLKVHKAIHTGEKPFECNICHERFALKAYLSGHFRKHTGERPYKCDQCDKTYKWKSHLRDHMRLHTGNLFKCTFCDSSFAKKCGLKRHLITHTGKKAYTCAKCDQSFGYLYVLRKHLVNVHDGVKSSAQDKRKSSNEVYTCDQCYKQVTTKQSLKKHIELHTAEKKFKCTQCNEWFSSKDYLSKHKWKHTDRYMCEECGRAFDGRTNFAPAIFYVNDSSQYSRRADEISKWKTTI